MGFRDDLNAHSGTLFSINNKLYSYDTCIAQKVNDKVYLNCTKYSMTTSHHQGLVRRVCNPILIPCTTIPIGINNLNKYINGR